jgi:hypothetical protein
LRQMGSQAVRHVRSRYSWARVAAETEAIYRRVGRPQSIDLSEPLPAAVPAEGNR